MKHRKHWTVSERKPVVATRDYDHFGEAMPDGRLTEPSNGKVYRLREAIAMSKKLGRPLTEEEMKEYEI